MRCRSSLRLRRDSGLVPCPRMGGQTGIDVRARSTFVGRHAERVLETMFRERAAKAKTGTWRFESFPLRTFLGGWRNGKRIGLAHPNIPTVSETVKNLCRS